MNKEKEKKKTPYYISLYPPARQNGAFQASSSQPPGQQQMPLKEKGKSNIVKQSTIPHPK